MHKYSRVEFQTKQDYTPIMIGSNSVIDVPQLEYHLAIYPYAHIFFMKTQVEHPDIITEIMT